MDTLERSARARCGFWVDVLAVPALLLLVALGVMALPTRPPPPAPAPTTGSRFCTNHAGIIYYTGTQGAPIELNPDDCSIPADVLPLGE